MLVSKWQARIWTQSPHTLLLHCDVSQIKKKFILKRSQISLVESAHTHTYTNPKNQQNIKIILISKNTNLNGLLALRLLELVSVAEKSVLLARMETATTFLDDSLPSSSNLYANTQDQYVRSYLHASEILSI